MTTNVSTLNDLIETLKDGQQGYQTAAAEVKSPQLKTLFGELSLQRSKFAGELQSIAHQLGDKDPATTGSTAGAIHRGWINLKAAFVAQDNHAILAECERGEDVAVDAYQKALEDSSLSKDVVDTVQRQFMEVQAAHDRVKALRDSMAEASPENNEATVPSARENPGGMLEKAPFGNT